MGWQIQEQLKGLFGSKEAKSQPFEQYLKAMGLHTEEQKKTDRKQRQLLKQQALEKVNKIIQLDKKRGDRKHG